MHTLMTYFYSRLSLILQFINESVQTKLYLGISLTLILLTKLFLEPCGWQNRIRANVGLPSVSILQCCRERSTGRARRRLDECQRGWRRLRQCLQDGLDTVFGRLGPHFERSLCFLAYNVIRRAYMNFRRPCGACNKPDAKNSIQGGLRQHDVVPRRYAAVERAVQIVERFKSQSRLAISFRLWDESEDCQRKRWFGHEREISRVLDESRKHIVQFNALEINGYEQMSLVDRWKHTRRICFRNPSTPKLLRTNHNFNERNRRPRPRCQLRYSMTVPL